MEHWKWWLLFDAASHPLSFLHYLDYFFLDTFTLCTYSVFVTCISFVLCHLSSRLSGKPLVRIIVCLIVGYILTGLSELHVNMCWFSVGYVLSSLIVNSMPPATDTWGSCPTSAARSIGVGYAHGPKTTPANLSTSLPSWDTKLAWPTPSERCTALDSVSGVQLESASWLHGRLEENYLLSGAYSVLFRNDD